MPTLLVVDSSPMTDTAVTRRLTGVFADLWSARFPHGRVIYRDVGATPPPHPDALTLAACAATPESTAPAGAGLTFVHLNDTYRMGAVEDGTKGGFGPGRDGDT